MRFAMQRRSHSGAETESIPNVESTPSVLDTLRQPASEHDASPAKCQPRAKMPQDAALAAAVGAVVLAFAACVYVRREPVADAGLGVEFVLPRPALLLEMFAFIALGMLAAPLPFAALLWCSHGRGDTTAASRPIDAMLVLYGAAALSIPFMLDAPHSGGLAPLSQALVIWIAYWKALDIVAGTAPPAVLASPLNLVAHLCFLVEYHIAAQPPHPTSPKLPPQPWWRNQGLLGTEIAPASELLPQLVEFATAGAGIMFFATVSMHSPPAWLVGSAAGGCVYTALLACAPSPHRTRDSACRLL